MPSLAKFDAILSFFWQTDTRDFNIKNQDSAIVKADVTVEVFDEETGNLIGTYVNNQENGKYSAILAPGKYFIEIVGLEGFKAYQKELEV